MEAFFCLFVVSKENLQGPSLIGDAVHAINAQIASAVEGAPTHDILKLEFASGSSILLLADTLRDLSNLQALAPNFAHQFFELCA